MIKNETQLKVTENKIEKLKASLKIPSNKEVSKPLAKAAKIQLKSLIKELEAQIKEYKKKDK